MSGKSIYANMTCPLQGLFRRFSFRLGLPYESDVGGCSPTLVGLSIAEWVSVGLFRKNRYRSG